MNILQKIFTDHFEEMIYLQHPRDSVIENVILIHLLFTASHPTSYLSLAGFEVCFSISHVSPGRSAV